MKKSCLSRKTKLRRVRSASVTAPVLALLAASNSSSVRADSVDLFSNTVTQSGFTFVYTYTCALPVGDYTGTTGYASVIDFFGLFGTPTWTPAASGGIVSTPLIAGLGNYTGPDSPAVPDLEVSFTTNVSNPAGPTALPITLGTLTAVSFYNYANGTYATSDNFITGGVDGNHGSTFVPVAGTPPPPPRPTPLPASVAGGLMLLGALALRKGTKDLIPLKYRRPAPSHSAR